MFMDQISKMGQILKAGVLTKRSKSRIFLNLIFETQKDSKMASKVVVMVPNLDYLDSYLGSVLSRCGLF